MASVDGSAAQFPTMATQPAAQPAQSIDSTAASSPSEPSYAEAAPSYGAPNFEGATASGGGPGFAGPAPYYGGPQYHVPEPDRLTRFANRLYARSPRWAAPVAALACMAAGIGYTLLVDPTQSAPDAGPTCVLKMTTGLDCPGCGGTRAMWYVLHGDVGAAARHHVFFVFALPFLIYLYVAWSLQQVFRIRLPQLRITPTVVGVFLAGWMAFSVLRNLPWAPFTWLYV